MNFPAAEMGQILVDIWGLAGLGIGVSGIGLLSYPIGSWLSKHLETVEEPDPTAFLRSFRKFFELSFENVGQTAASTVNSPTARQLAFQLSIGITVIVLASIGFVLSAGTVVVATSVVQSNLGITVDPTSIFRQIVAGITFLALVVIFHTQSQAPEANT